MKLDVAKNAKRNIFIGVLSKCILLIMPFFLRSVINISLGDKYLGLNSLFNSIIQVLSLSELGLSSALVYNMYKPVADNNQEKINALLNLYKKAYRIIGIVILFFGLILIPFLPNLINGEYPLEVNINYIYVIQLINTVLSYFLFAYKQSLLVAYQREDINSIINLVIQFSLQIIQIFLLIYTKNYYLYVLCMPVFTIITNIWIGIITKKMFPNAVCKGSIDKKDLKSIKKLIFGTFIQKACGITRNSLDSICISSFVGLSLTAIYNNYYTVFNGIVIILGIIQTSLIGGIGNHVALKNIDENFDELCKMDFLYMNLSGMCSICLLCLYQPFMKIWMGDNMILPMGIVVLIVLYFYILKLGDIRFIYSSAKGLWWEHRYRTILETISNIILNIVLGKHLGILGIVLATIISLIVFNFYWGSKIVFREYFGLEKLKKYIAYHIKYFLITLCVATITFMIISRVNLTNIYICFIIKGVLCVVISICMYIVFYYKTKIFKDSLNLVLKK